MLLDAMIGDAKVVLLEDIPQPDSGHRVRLSIASARLGSAT